MNKDLLESSALLTIQEAAGILGVSTKSLRRWDKAGILVPQRTSGNQRRYTKDQINGFKKKREMPYGFPSALNSSNLSFSTSPGGQAEGVPIAHHSGETAQRATSESPLVEGIRNSGQARMRLGIPNFFKVSIFAFGLCLLLGILTLALFERMGRGELVLAVKEYLIGPSPSSSPIGRGAGVREGVRDIGFASGEVLQASTIDNRLFFHVNIPSKFAQNSEFLKGLSAFEIATLSGGIITDNSDIDAGTGTLTASNVLYGVVAGTGISVGTTQTPTITNTDLGSSQNIFKTIKVGSDSFSSGSNTDTLEFASGTGISLSTDKSNKKVTITGSATSGWTDDGTAVRLTTSTDSVGIGTTSPSSKLDVLSTSEQLRLLYDSSNYTSFTISSGGDLTLNPTGGDIIFADADVLNIGGSGSDTAYNIIGDSSSGASSVVDSDDDLYIEGNIEIDGTVRLNNVSYTFPSADGSNSYVLSTNGSGTLSWSSADGGSNWRISSGAISPINDTLDVLIGNTATTSAKFGFLNVNTGTPTASVSAGTAGGAYLSATGTLATTALQTLTLGSSTTTGNVILNPSGNIGIGTASPVSGNKLHVEGQCVTGDTLLKRRRRRRHSRESGNPGWIPDQVGDDMWEYEDVRIDQIQAGDEVLTLEEITGEFVPQRVRKLMAMGKKEIYKLTTASGKTIRTTAEHPYLTLADDKQAFAFIDEAGVGKAPDQPVFGLAAFYIHDSLTINRKLHDIFTGAVSAYQTNESRFEFKFNAVTRNNLRFYQAMIEALSKDDSWSFAAVLTKKEKEWNYWDSYLEILPKLINKAPFARLTIVADYPAKPQTSKKDLKTITKMDKVAHLLQLESQGSLLLQAADVLLGALHFEERQKELGLTSGKEAKIKLAKLVKTLLAQKITAIECLHAVKDNLSQAIPAVKRQRWTKVKDLARGTLIATVDGWEKITKIERLRSEDVFDIEVENTHNFIGNNIVAHNTYISGNLGIGDTSPDSLLDILSATTGTNIIITNTNATDTDVTVGFALVDGTNNFTLGVDDSVTGDPFKISTTGLGTNDMLTLDSSTTTSGTSAITLAGIAPTIASAAGAEYTTLTLTPPTITLTGTTTVTSQMDTILISAPTITDSSVITVDDAATLTIAGAPITGASGSVTITDAYGLKINAASVDAGTGVVTRAYGLYVNAPTGAGTNYAASFAGGNVGIGTATPTNALEIQSAGVPLRIHNTTDAGTNQALIIRGANRATPTDGDDMYISFVMPDDAQVEREIFRINPEFTDVGTNTKNSSVFMELWNGNSFNSFFEIDLNTDNTGEIVFNETAYDVDFRIESDTNINALLLDSGTFGGVGQLSIGAAVQATATAFTVIDNPALTATANQNFYKLFIENTNAATIPTGTAAIVASLAVDEPNITATGTVTTGSTVYISGAPTEGSTNYSLWVDAGTSSFDGGILIPPETTGTFLDFALETEWTFGTLINADFASATTQGAGDIIGLQFDFDTNLTGATDRDITGANVLMNALTQSAANTTTYTGYGISAAGALTQDTAAGTINWRGANLTLPAITQTTGTITADGLRVLIPASAAITTAGTMNAINIIAPTTSGPAAGTLTGLNIAALTSAGAGTENAITIGSGWDMGISVSDNMLIGFGTAAGRIEFDDQATDEINILSARVGIGDATPDNLLDVDGGTSAAAIAITSTGTDTDALLKFELTDNTANFSLGVDDSVTGDPFKISTTGLGTNDMLTLDSSTTTSGTSAITLAGIAPTIASAAGAEYTTLTVTPPTITLTGGTQVTSQMDSILISQPTITDTTAITVDDAATMTIAGAAISGSAGSVTISDSYALKINTASVDAGTGTVTRAYGLYVDAPTGAGTNYAAVFATGNVGIGDATPDNALDLSSTDTSGNILTVGADSAVTLAGLLTGTNIDLSTNYTATNQSQTALDILLDGQTNTDTSGTDSYKGIEISGTALTQNGTGGTTRFKGVEVTMPAITQTAGTITADGLEITTGTITTGGTQNGIDIVAQGVGAGSLNGINIPAITAGGGTERAISIDAVGWDNAIYIATTNAGAEIYFTENSSTNIVTEATLFFDIDENNNGVDTFIIRNGGDAEIFRVEESGNIGIGGDTSPDSLLDILSATTGSDIIITNTNATDTDVTVGLALVDGTNNFTLGVDDSVTGDPFKISTTALGTGDTLTIDSSTTTSGTSAITLAGIAPTIASAAGAEYTSLTVTPPTITLTGGTGVTSVMDSILINVPTITDTTAVTIDKAATLTIAGNPTAGGSVTITAPRALNVDGRVEINLAGTQTSVALCGSHAAAGGASVSDVEIVDCTGTPGADYMEMYSVEQDVEQGDIVSVGRTSIQTINGNRLNKLAKSSQPYQANIIGIVSDPADATDFNSIGYNIKEEDNPKPIALSGRVKTKVSLENGSIESGDYLTSSSTPGVAMKATKAGQVVGIALEPLEVGDDDGKILVFVNVGWHDPSIYIAADGTLSTPTSSSSSSVILVTQSEARYRLAPGEAWRHPESPTVQSDSGLGQNDEVLNNPLFKDLSDKVSLLEQRINELAEMQFSASASALLSEIQQTSMEGIGEVGGMDVEELKNATVSGTLAVLGRATLTDLGVTGNINAGLLSIRGLDTLPCHPEASAEGSQEILRLAQNDKEECTGATINTLSGNLYLQNEGLGGVDILAGKITIDTKGNMVVAGTITADKVNIDESDPSSKSVGSVIIRAGETDVDIKTTALTSKSHIFATPDKPVAVGTKKKDIDTFTITLRDALSEDVKVNWWVIN